MATIWFYFPQLVSSEVLHSFINSFIHSDAMNVQVYSTIVIILTHPQRFIILRNIAKLQGFSFYNHFG